MKMGHFWCFLTKVEHYLSFVQIKWYLAHNLYLYALKLLDNEY